MRTMQQARRTNPYPWTWELPVAALALFVIFGILAVHVARAIANFSAGRAWGMTARSELLSSLPAMFSGDASTGLSAASNNVATDTALWAWMGGMELIMVVVALFVIRWWLVRWGPGRILGMATAGEVEQLLGRSRLRRNARLVRPDLYGAKAGS